MLSGCSCFHIHVGCLRESQGAGWFGLFALHHLEEARNRASFVYGQNRVISGDWQMGGTPEKQSSLFLMK